MATTSHERILRAAILTPTRKGWGLVVTIEDDPGTAKTSIMESLSETFGGQEVFPFEALSPGERGEGGFGVTPALGEDGYLSYPRPPWVRKFEEAGCGLILVDELTGCPPALQPALLGLLLDKRIGGHYLGDRVRLLGALNPSDQAAGGYDLACPAANRTGHLKWEAPDVTQWTDWLLGHDMEEHSTIDLTQEETRIMKAWPVAFAKARGLVAGFIRANSEALHRLPPEGHSDRSKAWPSRRTWEMATRALASGPINGLSQSETDTFASSFVGMGTFTEFVNWREEQDLPDPVAVLDGHVKFEHNPRRLDRTFAVLTSCAAIVAPKDAENRKARLTNFLNLARDTSKTALDITLLACKVVVKADPKVQRFNAVSKQLFSDLMDPSRQAKRRA